MTRFPALAVFILLAISALVPAHAAQSGLTRVGNYVGVKNLPIRKSLEEDMVRAGIPQQCRMEAHDVLTQFISYDLNNGDVARKNEPRLDILCAFEAKTSGAAKGMLGKAMGQTGSVGGVRYIHFRSKTRNVQRYILPPAQPRRAEAFARLLVLASTGSLSTSNLPCAASGLCGGASLFATPIAGAAITSNFGGRSSPGGVGSTNHQGQDFGAACGTPIRAAADGVIITSRTQITRRANGRTGGAGHYCQVRHGNGVVTEYFHMQGLGSCTAGATVRQGQQIGTVGNTGGSTGCHLHFGTLVNGQRVDPRRVTGIATNTPLTPEQAAQLQAEMASADNAAALLPDISEEGGLAGQMGGGDCPNRATGVSVFCDPSEEGGHEDHAEDDGHAH